MKLLGSSETRFPKVWCRSELCSRGKRSFEVRAVAMDKRYIIYDCPVGWAVGHAVLIAAALRWAKLGQVGAEVA